MRRFEVGVGLRATFPSRIMQRSPSINTAIAYHKSSPCVDEPAEPIEITLPLASGLIPNQLLDNKKACLGLDNRASSRRSSQIEKTRGKIGQAIM